MAQFPCLPIWTDAWVADTDHLTCEEEGIYFRLIRVMWRTPGCRVPNDVDWLAKHMRVTPKEVVEKVLPIIEHFCNTDGNFVYQKRLKREFVQRFEFGTRQSDRAKSRWRKKKDTYRNDAADGIAASGNAPFPSLPLITERPSSTAATPVDNSERVAKKQQDNPARSLATAPDVGALTREPDKEPAEPKQSPDKKPEEMTLAEINAIRYGTR